MYLLKMTGKAYVDAFQFIPRNQGFNRSLSITLSSSQMPCANVNIVAGLQSVEYNLCLPTR